MTSIQRVWETHSLKSQAREGQEGNHSILWGQRVGPMWIAMESGCGQRACAAADSWVLLLGQEAWSL